jgi:hypothetical protein
MGKSFVKAEICFPFDSALQRI